MNTSDIAKRTLGLNLACPPGSLTLAQAAELVDSILCLRTVVQHVYARHGYEIAPHLSQRLDKLTMTLSLAKARSLLSTWKRCTYRMELADFDKADRTALSACEQFLWSDTLRSL